MASYALTALAVMLSMFVGNIDVKAEQWVMLSSPNYMSNGAQSIAFHGPDGVLDSEKIREAGRAAAKLALERAGYGVLLEWGTQDPDLSLSISIAIDRAHRPICVAGEEKEGCLEFDRANAADSKHQPMLENNLVIADELNIGCELRDSKTYETTWNAAESVIVREKGSLVPVDEAHVNQLVAKALEGLPAPAEPAPTQ